MGRCDRRPPATHRLGRYEVDIPVVVVDCATGVACRFAVEVDNRFTHSTPKRRKRDAAKDRALGEAGWKVCRVDGGANNHVLAEQVADLALAMESHAAETFVNQSFRSSPEGSGAVQLTCGDCVQGGYCRLTVSSFCECRSRGGNERAALEDRSFPTTFADSESFDSFLEGVVDQVGVDLRGGEVPVSEGPFDHQDIAGAAVEVGGEGVPQTVGTDALADARLSQPVLDAVGDLPRRQARAAVGEEQRPAFAIALTAALVQVDAEEGAQRGL